MRSTTAGFARPLLWLLVLGIVALLTGGVALAAGSAAGPKQADGPRGVGSDPLTSFEEKLARDALVSITGIQTAAQRTVPLADEAIAAGVPPFAAPAEELLLIERRAPGKAEAAAAGGNPPRRADLYLYRYADDVLVHAVHDLQSGQITVVEEVRGVQLPLTQAERDLATRIAFADPALFAFLQDEHRAIVGEELRGPGQVQVRAFVYHSGAAFESEPPEAASCGIQRCAQLLFLTSNNVTYSILPVVNLSTLRTARVIPLATNPAEADTVVGEHEQP